MLIADDAKIAGARRDLPPSFWTWTVGLAVAFVASTVLLVVCYARSTDGARSGQYELFWVAVGVFVLPAAWYSVRERISRAARLVVVSGLGVSLYLPKLLRDPFGPLYHDELAHWRQTQDIATQGHLFVPNTIIPIISGYPGLHALTLTLKELSGMSAWTSGLVLLAVVHVIDLVVVFLLVEGFTQSARAGAAGAVIYGLNSSFMYFDDQFSYESLGIMLLLLCLLATQRAEQSSRPQERWAWVAVATLAGASCAITHHLSTVFLVAILLVWTALALLARSRRPGRDPSGLAVGSVTVLTCAAFGVWLSFVAPGTFTYLKPYLGHAVSQLGGMLGGGAKSQTPFGQATNPIWERSASFLAPLLVLAGVLIVIYRLYRSDPHRDFPSGRRASSGVITLILVGFTYFPSIPFLLAASGAEGARRSWAFSYLGVALILAPFCISWLRRPMGHRPRFSGGARLAVSIGFVVVLVGNVSAGLDASYRFPGPYAFASETYSVTPELRAMSRWFLETAGPGNRVVTDRFTALGLAALGQQNIDAPSDGFPTYQLWLDRSPPSTELINELETQPAYQYLVIDKRMALPVVDLSGFFTGGTPVSSDGTTVVTAADLNRFASYSWCSRVYESTNYAVYHLNYGDVPLPVAGPQAK